jgi:hypothetical protein
MTYTIELAKEFSCVLRAIPRRFGHIGIFCLAQLSNNAIVDHVIFEVGTAMIIHSMDPPDLFPYKRPQMEMVFKAFQNMLHNAAHII